MIPRTRGLFETAPNKSIAFLGMSGVGKTRVSQMLRDSGDWYHYSVDYRIGTRYMDEHIVDGFKREAMKSPLLRELLLSDSIYIRSNIAFENLAPLSTYLGKPGAAELGGLPFDEYVTRQRQHAAAERSAVLDAIAFKTRAQEIYGYPHFICDMSGSVVEIVDPDDADDPLMTALEDDFLFVFIRGAAGDAEELAARFEQHPKPMYYDETFLRGLWTEYLETTNATADAADPDGFARWGFRRLIDRRAPRYQAIANRWGVTIDKAALAAADRPEAVVDLIAEAIDRRGSAAGAAS